MLLCLLLEKDSNTQIIYVSSEQLRYGAEDMIDRNVVTIGSWSVKEFCDACDNSDFYASVAANIEQPGQPTGTHSFCFY